MGVCLHNTRQIVQFVVGLEDARVAVLLQEGKKKKKKRGRGKYADNAKCKELQTDRAIEKERNKCKRQKLEISMAAVQFLHRLISDSKDQR